MEKAYLVLENGNIYEGYSFGAKAEAIGELVFTTGVCGYIETLTDPSFYGQIVIQTFPLVGNYGVISEDIDGKCSLFGYVVREWCEEPSNFRCETTLDEYLKAQGVPGIYGVDTRHLTAVLREQGVMNAAICSEIPEDLTAIKEYKIINAVESVTDKEVKKFFVEDGKYSVALIDYGTKNSTIKALNDRGCNVTVYPANTPLYGVLPQLYDGIVLSSGPDEPKEGEYTKSIKDFMGVKPILAIGLGHQLLAIANNGKVEKMKYGHRGANQPSKHIPTGRTYITQQNHGYTVLPGEFAGGEVSFVNVNDSTVEGIDYKEKKAVSVQFYPENKGTTSFVYDMFIDYMGGGR